MIRTKGHSLDRDLRPGRVARVSSGARASLTRASEGRPVGRSGRTRASRRHAYPVSSSSSASPVASTWRGRTRVARDPPRRPSPARRRSSTGDDRRRSRSHVIPTKGPSLDRDIRPGRVARVSIGARASLTRASEGRPVGRSGRTRPSRRHAYPVSSSRSACPVASTWDGWTRVARDPPRRPSPARPPAPRPPTASKLRLSISKR